MCTLGGDDSITPRVTFLSYACLSKRHRGFAKPGFRPCFSFSRRSSQASFCPYTLPQISDLGELTFGHQRYLFVGVPPQPNYPPSAVLGFPSEWYEQEWAVLHWRLHAHWRERFEVSCLRYTPPSIPQRQAVVKLLGSFRPTGSPWPTHQAVVSRGPRLGQWGHRYAVRKASN